MNELDIFIEADKDYNGRLTYLELNTYAHSTQQPELVKIWFEKFDTDSKGFITVEDIKRVLQKSPNKEYIKHVEARSLAKNAIQAGTSKYRSEQIADKAKSMKHFFDARNGQFICNGSEMGEIRELTRNGRLELNECTHAVLFDKQRIGELDCKLKFTRAHVDKSLGEVFIDGLNHGTFADLFYGDLLNLGLSREPYDLAVCYSQKHDSIFINGHFIGTLDNLYANRKLVLDEASSTILYNNVPIGYSSPEEKFTKIKEENNRVSFNGSKTTLLSEHAKNGTIIMRKPGYIPKLGSLFVNEHTGCILIDGKEQGFLGNLIHDGIVKIKNDKVITYREHRIGCLDDQLPTGKYTYNNQDNQIYCDNMPIGQIDDILERRQFCIAGINRGRPKLYFNDKEQLVFLDSLFLGDFSKICNSKLISLNSSTQCIYYGDIEVSRMPDNWRDYQIQTVEGGYVTNSKDEFEKFQKLYFESKVTPKPRSGGAQRRVIISKNSHEIFLDGNLIGLTDELIRTDRLKLDDHKMKITLDNLEIGRFPSEYVNSESAEKLKEHPDVFMNLYYYVNSTHICVHENTVYENGQPIGKLEDVLKSSRIKYSPASGCFALDNDNLAYVTIIDRNQVAVEPDGLIYINGKKKTFMEAVKANEIYVHTSPFEYGINKLNIYSCNDMKVQQPIANIKNLISQKDARLQYRVQDGVVLFNDKYLVTRSKSVDEQKLDIRDKFIGPAAHDSVLENLFDDKNRLLFQDLRHVPEVVQEHVPEVVQEHVPEVVQEQPPPTITIEQNEPTSVHAAPVTESPKKIKPVGRIGFYIDEEKQALFLDQTNLGSLSDLISKKEIYVDFHDSCLKYKDKKICQFGHYYAYYMDPAKLTPDSVSRVFFALKYDGTSKQIYRGNVSIGRLDDKVKQKKITVDEEHILCDGIFLTYLPLEMRHFDYKLEGEVMVSIGPLTELYIDNTTSERIIHVQLKPNYQEHLPILRLDSSGNVFNMRNDKIDSLQNLISKGNLTYNPSDQELTVENKSLCILSGDINQYSIKYDPIRLNVINLDINAVIKAYSNQDIEPSNFPYLGPQGHIYYQKEHFDVKKALDNKDLTVDLPKGELLYKKKFLTKLPMNYDKLGVQIDQSGNIICKSLRNFMNLYQAGMREHFGGIYDIDYSNGIVYIKDFPVGSIQEIVNRGKATIDIDRKIILISGHYFCPLLPIYRRMGLNLDSMKSVVSKDYIILLILLHRLSSATREICPPDYFIFNQTRETIYIGPESLNKNFKDFIKGLKMDDLNRILLHDDSFLTVLPQKEHRLSIYGFDTNESSHLVTVADQAKFKRYLNKYLLDWRLIKLSGEIELTSVEIIEKEKAILFKDINSSKSIDKLMLQKRIWYDCERGNLLVDGCLICCPSRLTILNNVKIDPRYHFLTALTSDIKQLEGEDSDLKKKNRQCYMLHNKNLNALTKSKKLEFKELGIIYLNGSRVGNLHQYLSDSNFKIITENAEVIRNGLLLGTVEDCFDKALIEFEFEFVQTASMLKANRLGFGKEYDSKKNNGNLEYFNGNEASKENSDGFRININGDKRVPKELLEFTKAEIKKTFRADVLEKDLARAIKQKLDEEFGRVWQAVASRSTIGCKVSHLEDMFMNIEYEGVTYIIFRTPDYY